MSIRPVAVNSSNQVGKAIEIAAGSTQPVIYGVATATVLGLQFNEWIMVGSAILLILNLGLSITKLVTMYQNKQKLRDKEL